MSVTLECTATRANEMIFIEDNYAALAQWDHEYAFKQMRLIQCNTLLDCMWQKLHEITGGWTGSMSVQDIAVTVEGYSCSLAVDYNPRSLRSRFILDCESELLSIDTTIDDRDLA